LKNKIRKIINISFLFLIILSFGISSSSTKNSYSFPVSTLEDQKINPNFIEDMDNEITSKLVGIRSSVIARNGYLVYEKYYSDIGSLKNNIYSVTKSVISALIGIAIDKTFIDNIDVPILNYFPEISITTDTSLKETITLKHLLTMTAGIKWNELTVGYDDANNDLYLMWESLDWIEFVLNKPMEIEPGKKFTYNSGISHLLSAILTKATNQTTLSFAEENLFNPLDIQDYNWPQDPNGIYKGGEGLELSPLSLLKIGQLYLNNGSFDNQILISKEWVIMSQIDNRPIGHDSYGYGFQWWVHPNNFAYSAWGYAEQRVIIVPKYNLVAVFTARLINVPGDPCGELVPNFIIPAIENYPPTNNEEPTNADSFLFLLVAINITFISLIRLRSRIKHIEE
jgi:CubicO group peptidase (beta-lactamase class C family)